MKILPLGRENRRSFCIISAINTESFPYLRVAPSDRVGRKAWSFDYPRDLRFAVRPPEFLHSPGRGSDSRWTVMRVYRTFPPVAPSKPRSQHARERHRNQKEATS